MSDPGIMAPRHDDKWSIERVRGIMVEGFTADEIKAAQAEITEVARGIMYYGHRRAIHVRPIPGGAFVACTRGDALLVIAVCQMSDSKALMDDHTRARVTSMILAGTPIVIVN